MTGGLAAGNMGVATAYGAWSELGGAALQLGVNVIGLVVAGVTTPVIQARLTASRPPGLERLTR